MPRRIRPRLIPGLIPVLALALALVLPSPASAQTPLDTLVPFGFDGLDLGLPLEAAPSLIYSQTLHVHSEMDGDQNMDFYVRQGQSLAWEGLRLQSVEYGFCEGTLCSILIKAAGREAFEAMVEHWRDRYGTDERTAFAYETVWVRQYHDEEREYGRQHLWIVCERQTDNCALSAIRWYENEQTAVINIGQQLDY